MYSDRTKYPKPNYSINYPTGPGGNFRPYSRLQSIADRNHSIMPITSQSAVVCTTIDDGDSFVRFPADPSEGDGGGGGEGR